MNDFNDFYEEPRKLNIKKVVIISIIFVIILFSLIFFIAKKISSPKNASDNNAKESSTVFYSDDNSISIEVSKNFHLKKYDSDLNYLLELRSDDNLNIFISKEKSMQNKELLEVIEADKIAFLNNFEKNSNLSDIKELSVNNNLAYTYSFHYLDQKLATAYYLQVIWLQIKDSYYVFDIEFPLDDLSFNTNIASSILSSFKEI